MIFLPILIFLLSPNSVAEDINPSATSEINSLLKQVETGDKDACFKLYSMGSEIEPILLQEFVKVDISQKNWYTFSHDLAAILSLRGYDKDLLNVLKRRLKDDDPQERISAACIVAQMYEYYSIKDLAAVVSGKRDAAVLDEQLFYESSISSEEFINQVLEILQSDSEISKDFVITFLKNLGFDCSNCGINPKKWKKFLQSKKELDTIFWFPQRYMEIEDGPVALILGVTASPDGETIAFVPRIDSEKKSDCNLWVMDTTTNKITRILIPGCSFSPSWAPTSDMIAFNHSTSKGFNIGTINKDGSNFSVWTRGSYHTFNQWQRWFPTSNKVAYLRQVFINRNRIDEIWEVDIDANRISRMAQDNHCTSINRLYRIWFPTISDDLYILDCAGSDKTTEGLYRIPQGVPDERHLLQPFDFAKMERFIQPSPDESKVSYSGDCKLNVRDLTTGETREYDTGDAIGHFWTPDGTRIIYGNNRKVRALALETGEVTELSEGNPAAFGPGGKSVYYTKFQSKSPSIWRINLDGTDNKKIFPVEGIEYTSVQAHPVLQ